MQQRAALQEKSDTAIAYGQSAQTVPAGAVLPAPTSPALQTNACLEGAEGAGDASAGGPAARRGRRSVTAGSSQRYLAGPTHPTAHVHPGPHANARRQRLHPHRNAPRRCPYPGAGGGLARLPPSASPRRLRTAGWRGRGQAPRWHPPVGPTQCPETPAPARRSHPGISSPLTAQRGCQRSRRRRLCVRGGGRGKAGTPHTRPRTRERLVAGAPGGGREGAEGGWAAYTG